MAWRQIHRWLGLMAGALALVIGITGAVLAPPRPPFNATFGTC